MPRSTRKKVKVPLYNQPAGRVAQLEDGATQGATIGVDLLLPDGSIATVAALQALLGSSSGAGGAGSGLGPISPTIWNLIAEIPANVVEVAELATSGLVVRKASGDWITRSIGVASTDRLTIANADGDAGTPTLDMADLVGLSVWGRSVTSTGKPDEITGTANQVLRVNGAGTALGFGAIDLAQAAAIGTSRLPFANLTQIAGLSVLGVTGGSTADVAGITAAADDRILARVAGAVIFTQLTAGMFPNTVVPNAALQATVALTSRDPQTFAGVNIFAKPLRLPGYTVATLPAGTVGDRAYVTDATAPVYGVAAVGGGAVVVPVFYNGAAWITA